MGATHCAKIPRCFDRTGSRPNRPGLSQRPRGGSVGQAIRKPRAYHARGSPERLGHSSTPDFDDMADEINLIASSFAVTARLSVGQTRKVPSDRRGHFAVGRDVADRENPPHGKPGAKADRMLIFRTGAVAGPLDSEIEAE